VAVSAVVLGAGVFQLGPHVFARDYDAEIDALNRQAQQAQNEANRLGTMAATLEEELGRINAQIDSIRTEIAKSQQKHNALVAEITKNKLAIEKSRKVMGKILSDIYLDDQISPLEMLASSKSIGDYVDKQEQRSSLRSSLLLSDRMLKTSPSTPIPLAAKPMTPKVIPRGAYMSLSFSSSVSFMDATLTSKRGSTLLVLAVFL